MDQVWKCKKWVAKPHITHKTTKVILFMYLSVAKCRSSFWKRFVRQMPYNIDATASHWTASHKFSLPFSRIQRKFHSLSPSIFFCVQFEQAKKSEKKKGKTQCHCSIKRIIRCVSPQISDASATNSLSHKYTVINHKVWISMFDVPTEVWAQNSANRYICVKARNVQLQTIYVYEIMSMWTGTMNGIVVVATACCFCRYKTLVYQNIWRHIFYTQIYVRIV